MISKIFPLSKLKLSINIFPPPETVKKSALEFMHTRRSSVTVRSSDCYINLKETYRSVWDIVKHPSTLMQPITVTVNSHRLMLGK